MTASVRLGSYSEKAPSNYVLPDEDTYVVKLDDWDEPKRSDFIDKESGEYPLRIQLKFKIQKSIEGDAEFADVEVSRWCGLDLNPNDKGSIWHVLLALDPGTDPEPDMELSDYRGKSCKAVIEHTKPKAGKDGQLKVYANISKVMAIKKPKPAAVKEENALIREDEDE